MAILKTITLSFLIRLCYIGNWPKFRHRYIAYDHHGWVFLSHHRMYINYNIQSIEKDSSCCSSPFCQFNDSETVWRAIDNYKNTIKISFKENSVPENYRMTTRRIIAKDKSVLLNQDCYAPNQLTLTKNEIVSNAICFKQLAYLLISCNWVSVISEIFV